MPLPLQEAVRAEVPAHLTGPSHLDTSSVTWELSWMSHTWNPLAYPSSSIQRWSCRPACSETWRQAGRAKPDERTNCAHDGAAPQGNIANYLSPVSRKQVRNHQVLLPRSKDVPADFTGKAPKHFALP